MALGLLLGKGTRMTLWNRHQNNQLAARSQRRKTSQVRLPHGTSSPAHVVTAQSAPARMNLPQ